VAISYQNSLPPCITCVQQWHAAKRPPPQFEENTWRFVAMLLLRNKVKQ